MRYALAALCVVHGVAHLVEFLVAWRMVGVEHPDRTKVLWGRVDLGEVGIRTYGVVWLLLAVGFAGLTIGVLLRSPWWLQGLLGLVTASLLFCLVGLPETRFGVAANGLTVLLALAAVQYSGRQMAIRDLRLEELWRSAPRSRMGVFNGSAPAGIPEGARKYLEHAIAPGTRLATAVRLRMHGEIKIGNWRAFEGEEVISGDRGMVWAATASMVGLPVVGADRVVDGEGSMEWRMLDVLPVMKASGADVTRSGLGRFAAEAMTWIPSLLVDAGKWMGEKGGRLRARMEVRGETTEMEMTTDGGGGLKEVRFNRWGNPEGQAYRLGEFRVVVDHERAFEGYTVPSRVRAGWVGAAEGDGEFFRATIDGASYR